MKTWQEIKHDKKERLTLFLTEIRENRFPEKCLACYAAGLNHCRYWETKFNCEEYEVGQIEEIAKKFK
jgi:hypothetical protein